MRFSDDASDFVSISEAIPLVLLDIRYYSAFNFIGERIDGYEEPIALMTKAAASALQAASDELNHRGYLLRIFDAYRPQTAVDHFMRWAENRTDTRMKSFFYPDLTKDRLIPGGYIAKHSGHSRGSTVDLTLFDTRTQKEVDMGGPFDFLGPLSHTDCAGITGEQHDRRMLLRETMMRHGFRPLKEEWWHFTLENEPWPDTYFTFPVSGASLK